jgi:glycosyltransferase involved in cell wall biosynthesis
MSRLMVLHCIYDDPANPWLGGGGAHRAFELYRRLTDSVDATVATGAYPGAADGHRDGVRYIHLGLRWPYPMSRLTYAIGATRLLEEGEYDAAVFDFSVYTPIRVPDGRPVGHVVHMPIGATARGRWGRIPGGLVAWWERRMLGVARRVQTTSNWMAARLRPLVDPDARIDIVRSGVDDVFFGLEREDPVHLLSYGRLDVYQKGLDLLLEAYARFRHRHPSPPPLVIAGRGDRRRVEAAMATARAAGVRVEAPVDRPRVLEGFPVVPLEAMAAGVPVVATRVGGLEEIVAPGTGILVPPEDVEALVAALMRLTEGVEERARMSAAAREAATRFTWDAAAADHRAFLESLAGS